jgi:hypothetical protein
LFCSNSFPLHRHHIHQQPPQAPRSPNNFSRSSQRFEVKGWTVRLSTQHR